MPRDIIRDLKKKMTRKNFFKVMSKERRGKLPKKVRPQKVGTLVAKRNRRVAIREAAKARLKIILNYKKVTTGKIKRYAVDPYSFRTKRLKAGLRKVLYAYDAKEHTIKNFVLRNILNVVISDTRFRPKWKIEIKTVLMLLIPTLLFS